MEPSVLDRVGKLLNRVNTLKDAMAAAIEPSKNGPAGYCVFKAGSGPGAFAKPRRAFNESLPTIRTTMIELEDAGYVAPPRKPKERYIYSRKLDYWGTWALDDGHAPDPEEMATLWEAVVNTRDNARLLPDALHVLGSLEEGLIEARKWTAKKCRKRITPVVPLQMEDKTILETLAEEYPAAVTNPDLAGATNLDVRIISKRVKWLEAKPRRFVKRPEGTQRKGHAITPAGLSVIGCSMRDS